MSDTPAEEQMKVTPEEMKKGMEPWFTWFEKAGSALVDKGMPIGNAWTMTKEGAGGRTSHVAGFSIVQADSSDAVKELIKDHPHLMFPGASIEVLEYLPMPGMPV